MTPAPLKQAHLDYLLRLGVTMEAICWPQAMLYIKEEPSTLYFPDDDATWQPKHGDKLTGHFCLGADNIMDADNYSFDGALEIHETPLQWLKTGRRGIVVIDWSRIFHQLQDAPRVSVPKSLMAVYRKHMKPPRLPDVRERIAA